MSNTVYQYNILGPDPRLEGNLIATFSSLAEASKSTGISKQSICNCLSGLSKSTRGSDNQKSRWSYNKNVKPNQDGTIKCDLEEYKLNYKTIKVYQYDFEGKLLGEFASQTEASKTTGVDVRYISDCVNGRYKSGGGYIWTKEKKESVEKYEGPFKRAGLAVHQYSLDGTYIASFSSQIEASKKTSTNAQIISDVLNGRALSGGNYLWSRELLDKIPSYLCTRLESRLKSETSNLKKIYCYDLQGQFIKEYNGLQSAELDTGVDKRAISSCCLGKDNRKKTGIYQFRYEYFENLDEYTRNKGPNAKTVFQFDENGELLASFDSINEACKILDVDRSSLSGCINGKNRTAGEYRFSGPGPRRWSETDEYDIEKERLEIQQVKEEANEKRKATCLEKYEVEYVSQLEQVKEKTRSTCLEKYSVENPSQCLEIQEKMRTTCLENYRIEYVFQSEEFKEKRKNTMIERYGVEHPAQSEEIFKKILNNGYKKKLVNTPNGESIYLQGYEPQAYNILLQIYKEEEIITDNKLKPEIWWNDDEGKRHRYFPDFYIPKENLVIEIKSSWTFQKDKKKIKKTQEQSIKLGYKFELWVLNVKGEQLEIKN